MKSLTDGIWEARNIAQKINRKDGGEMCAYIYMATDGGYVVMDECDDSGDECDMHIETWQYGKRSYKSE